MKATEVKTFGELKAKISDPGIMKKENIKAIEELIRMEKSIDRSKADFLFEVNDIVSGADNDPSWKDLFVKALASHVLEDEISPEVLDEDEAKYLISRIQQDGVVDDVELALLVHIIQNAKSTPEFFQEFVLSSLKDAILEDGIIDEDEVKMIRKVIYGVGGGAGEGVDRAEADFIFDLNDATTGKDNHPSWNDLFVESISKHVLEDEISPGEIDEDEARWLITRIEGDEQYDENEKALLRNIRKNAKSIAKELEDKMAPFGI